MKKITQKIKQAAAVVGLILAGLFAILLPAIIWLTGIGLAVWVVVSVLQWTGVV